MKQHDHKRVRELIDRLGRILAADEWNDEINPTQWTALSYLACANKFSRSPSQVADYMTATRGTVSQTLKALARKGLIVEHRSEQDKRYISYSVTEEGLCLLERESPIEEAVSALLDQQRSDLLEGLETLVRKALHMRGSQPFGVCKTCVHHQKQANGGRCLLLDEPLTPVETQKICHEHSRFG